MSTDFSFAEALEILRSHGHTVGAAAANPAREPMVYVDDDFLTPNEVLDLAKAEQSKP
ncbi:hypothetical protein HDF16_001604 [Granulicella aggregans]|uniref:Uncharacterized protein n=1 Tax=Granulicella aggregans TaxID=474949 RepID=A0A7W7ZBL3_9BACT|nr:hypothetical protein [Granulicella aggregans]MBB5056919.1 hypothetical protein [Granulicella aggregans]